MSTVAVKGNVIAADTKISGGVPMKGSKLFVTPKGVVGFSGTYSSGLRFVDWYRNQRKKKPEFNDEDFIALVLLPHGEVEMWDDALHPWKVDPAEVELGYAIGSGGEYATGAMRAGLGAVEAVEVACSLDKGSALPIESEEV